MKKNSMYAYPAVFEEEDGGLYSVVFPDIEGCFTCGNDLTDAIHMATDALALMIYTNFEETGIDAPKATPIDKVKHKKNAFVSYVLCDTKEYRKKFGKKAVKKTLTIPEWLNRAATKQHINFSQVLQEALENKLDVS